MYDLTTRNKSFIKISNILKDKGVTNHRFMLYLENENLAGVNPHDKNLTARQKAEIIMECHTNVWYFLREVVRIPVPGADDGIPYELNLGNLAMSYMKINNIHTITTLPRQSGKTIGNIIMDVYIFYFLASNTTVTYGNKTLNDSKLNLKRFTDIKDILPIYIREFVSDPGDINNQERKTSKKRNNTLVAISAPISEEQADKLGRGSSTPLIFLDEIAFLKHNKIVLNALGPAYSKSAEMAKKQGSPFSKTYATTPNNLEDPSGTYCYNVLIGSAVPFEERMYDMTPDYLSEFIKHNSQNDMVYITYSWADLGRDQEWYTEQCRNLNNDQFYIKRELDLAWTFASDNSVFSEEQLDTINGLLKSSVNKMRILDYYEINFYKEIDFSKNYIITCDVAAGLSNDSSAFSVVDPATFEIVGIFRNATIDTDAYRRLLEQVMKFYMPNAILIIEANSYGKNILDTLCRDREIEPRLFYTEVQPEAEKRLNKNRVVRTDRKLRRYGMTTTSKNRPVYFELLRDVVESYPEQIAIPEIFEELKNLIFDDKGRIDHRQGAHDDCIMSYLVFRYSLQYEDVLTKKFKISKIPSYSSVRSNRINGSYSESILRNATTMINVFNNADNMSNKDPFIMNNFISDQIAINNEIETNPLLKSKRRGLLDMSNEIPSDNNQINSYDEPNEIEKPVKRSNVFGKLFNL